MNMDRRAFLTTGASIASTLAHSSSSMAAPKSGEFEAIRGEFPRAVEQVYLDAAANTPLPKYTAEGMKQFKERNAGGEGYRRWQQLADAVGCQVKSAYVTMGRFDGVAIIEAPDDTAVARLALAMASSGLRSPFGLAFSAARSMRAVGGKRKRSCESDLNHDILRCHEW